MPIRACAILFFITLVFRVSATAQTWVTAWTAGAEGLSSSEAGALLTVEETADPGNLWAEETYTFASGGLTSASGSFQKISLSGGGTLRFTLESGYVFDKFMLVDTAGDTSSIASSLGTGTWTIIESVAGSAGSAFLSDSDTTLNHAGALIASAGGGVNSFEITFNDQLEDSRVGIGYSVVAVPEPSAGGVLGLTGLVSLTRRRRSATGKVVA